MKNERGSFTLILGLVMVPLLVMISLSTVAISKYYYQHQIIQQYLDQAVKIALQSMPNYSLAQTNLANFLESKGISSQSISSVFDGKELTIKYQENYRLSFSDYFLDFEIPLKVLSSGTKSSEIFHLVIDLFSDQSFTETDYYWPASQFINNYFSDYNYHQYASTPENLTAKCFNSEFNLMKLAGLELADYFFLNQKSKGQFWTSTESDGQIVPEATTLNFTNGFKDYCWVSAWEEQSFNSFSFPFLKSQQLKPYHLGNNQIEFSEDVSLSVLDSIWGLRQNDQGYLQIISALAKIYQEVISSISPSDNLKIVIVSKSAPKNFTDYAFNNNFRAELEKFTSLSTLNIKANIYIPQINLNPASDDYLWQEYLAQLSSEYQHTLNLKSQLILNSTDLSKFISRVINEQQQTIILK